MSEHYSEFRQIDTAFLPWGWISVAIHPVGPKRELRSPLFVPTLSLLVREKYFLRRPYSRTFKFEGGRGSTNRSSGCDRARKRSTLKDDAVEQEAVQQLGVREQ